MSSKKQQNNKNNISCFYKTNRYFLLDTFHFLLSTLYFIPNPMIDTDTFIEQMIIKAAPEIDDEGLDMMIEDTKPVLYDRVMTHIVGKIDEKEGQ